MTLVVNLFGGPGIGKSTTAALAFGKLKQQGVNCELVTEVAKDLTWEKREVALGYQPYIISKQMFKIYRLLGQVDVVITDSPILLGAVYGEDDPLFERWLVSVHDRWRTLNIKLARNPGQHPYLEVGRTGTEAQATARDKQITQVLTRLDIPTHTLVVDEHAAQHVTQMVLTRL